MLNIFFLSFIYGISLSIMVGPIAIIIINNGIAYGRKPALKSAFGAATADLVFIIVAFIGSTTIVNLLEVYSKELQFIASFFILAFGLKLVFSSSTPIQKEGKDAYIGFAGTFLLTIINPLTIITISALSIVIFKNTEINSLTLVLAVIGFFLGSLVTQILFALISSSFKKKATNYKLIIATTLIGGTSIFIIGVKGLIDLFW